MKSEFPNASDSFKRLNPHLFGAVGGLRNKKPEPNPLRALEQKPKARSGRARRILFSIEIVSARRRLLDDDNLAAGAKGLRDSVAASCGIDDNDPRVEWIYHQIKTRGKPGTIVKIQAL